ncbi:putative oxidoreductase isoform A [Neolecta irregularis DAH-3]|nr:putative oxidoreductase isoform A [Neolecta irregularis DAH-3]|eukprot:OLL23827.1 putative oxidoreductase isoform A [Neolecta irregularis DAH-3]
MVDNIVYYECDVASREQVEQVALKIKERLGIVSILINNAGILVRKPLLEQTHEEIQRVIDVNLFGHFNTLKAFLPDMQKLPYGHIVSISSAIASYAASKAALFTLHESLLVELPESIQKSLFIFGQLSTPMFSEVETPNKLVAPVIEGITAAKEVVQVIKDGRGGEFSMPLYVRYMGLMRVLPAGIVKAARWWSGGDIAALGRKVA